MKRRNPFLLDRPARVALSGGRTSGLMAWKIREAFGGTIPDDVYFTFANTGREVEETLRFVQEMDARWRLRVRWVEYERDKGAPLIKPGTESHSRPLIGCHSFRVVDFVAADRSGVPFEEVTQVKAEYRAHVKDEPPVLPNPTDRWCSGELKHRTMHRFMQSIGVDEYTCAVGLRFDEPKRVRDMLKNTTGSIEYVCPMADAGLTEQVVLDFWSNQPFDLELEHDPELGTFEGNCDLCFLKNRKKMARLLQVRPEAFDWWAEMEERTGQTFRRDRPNYRQMADQRVSLAMCETPDEDLGVCLCTD